MSRLTYARIKAVGGARYQRILAKSRDYYTAHREEMNRKVQAYYAQHREEITLIRNNLGTHSTYHGPLVGCCGQWWPITTLPFHCPLCATMYFEEGTYARS